MKKLTATGYLAQGAIMTYLAPRLALDASIDLKPILAGVTAKNFTDKSAGLASRIRSAVRGKLAQDADIEDLVELLDAIGEEREGAAPEGEESEDDLDPSAAVPMAAKDPDDDTPPAPDDDDAANPMLANVKKIMTEAGVAPEVMAKVMEAVGSHEMAEGEAGEDDEMEDEPWKTRAMDARKRLGRDESDEERDAREKRESAEDAKMRLGRDESEEEAMDRTAKDAKRAMDRKTARDRRMARDEPPPFKGRPNPGGTMDRKAMDAAISAAVDGALTRERANQAAIRTAERDVQPYVGNLRPTVAFDSAAAVYKHALIQNGVKTDGVDPSAFKTILELLPKAGARREPTRLAQDSATRDSFDKRFPAVARINHA